MTQKERAHAMVAFINNRVMQSIPSFDALMSELRNAPDGSVDGDTLRHLNNIDTALTAFRTHVKNMR